MPALGQRTPPHIRALDKTLIGEAEQAALDNVDNV